MATVQTLEHEGTFSGFRICYNCMHTGRIDPSQRAYKATVPCSQCKTGEFVPLLDSEVIYYLRNRLHILKAFRNLRELLQ